MVSGCCRVFVRVKGRVQGVGYRYYVQRVARQLGLTGYVRNEPDASVLAEAQGPRAALEDFLQRLQTGPMLAEVTDLRVDWIDPVPQEREFTIAF